MGGTDFVGEILADVVTSWPELSVFRIVRAGQLGLDETTVFLKIKRQPKIK